MNAAGAARRVRRAGGRALRAVEILDARHDAARLDSLEVALRENAVHERRIAALLDELEQLLAARGLIEPGRVGHGTGER